MPVRTGKTSVAPENMASDPVGYLTENQSKERLSSPRGLARLDVNLIWVMPRREAKKSRAGPAECFPTVLALTNFDQSSGLRITQSKLPCISAAKNVIPQLLSIRIAVLYPGKTTS
jgi:hypothetical protein